MKGRKRSYYQDTFLEKFIDPMQMETCSYMIVLVRMTVIGWENDSLSAILIQVQVIINYISCKITWNEYLSIQVTWMVKIMKFLLILKADDNDNNDEEEDFGVRVFYIK